MAGAAPGENLVVRNPGLEWSGGYRRFWYRNSAFLTNSMNALSIVIPEGEHFFIESVRHYLGEIRDPVLHAQAIAFVGQEGAHAREHRRYNELVEAQGYPVRPIAEQLRRHLKLRGAGMPPRARLAMTCALEHFTTILGAEFLRNPICRESVTGELAQLWFWHGVEELEHKCVAFDVYKAIGGTYWERVREMIGASLGFWTLWLAITLTYQSHDRRLWSPGEWWTALLWLFVRPAYLLRLMPRYLAYYRPGFHPSQDAGGDAKLILDWRARLGLAAKNTG
jgi:predicted metal-dependent hydrolase